MPGRRRAAKSKTYLWSNYYKGGEARELPSGRKITESREILAAGSECSQDDLGVDDAEFQRLKDTGVVRDYPYPDGYEGDAAEGMSPYTYVVEKAREELEAAEEEAGSMSAEDRLVRASVVGTQVFGPNPEEVLMGLDEGVEEVSEEPEEE